MGFTLVFPGNHRQFMAWVRLEMDRGNMGASRARVILNEDQLRGIHGADVDEIYYVGTYAQDNPAWMSGAYEILMNDGFVHNKVWFRDGPEDLRRAYETPVPPEQMAAVRGRLQDLERRLSE